MKVIKNIFISFAVFLLIFVQVANAATTTFLVSNPGKGNQTWTVPDDWNSSNNTIECIGAGGNGSDRTVGSTPGTGGGGAAYAKISNFTLTPGASVTYAIGGPSTTTSGMVASETYFNSTASSSASLYCDYGRIRIGAGASGGAPGSATRSIGTITFAGGTGGGASNNANRPGGGGAGSAGPIGIGKAGGAGNSTGSAAGGGGGGGSNGGSSSVGGDGGASTGAAGGNGRLGTGSGAGAIFTTDAVAGTAGGGGGGGASTTVSRVVGAAGGCDISWDSTHGACGGGGGGGATTTSVASLGGAGGTYGGGGGGAGGVNTAAGGAGGQGIIVIRYNPIASVAASGRIIRLLGGTRLRNGVRIQ